MKHTRVGFVVALLSLPALSGAATAPELFAAAQQQVRTGAHDEALRTLDELFAIAADLPAVERSRLLPPVLFLSGWALAEEKESEAAETDLALYQILVPGAELDESFPKRFKKAFKAAERGRDDLAACYARFRELPFPRPSEPARLASGPLRRILDEDRLEALGRASDPADTEAILLRFWVERAGSETGGTATHEEVLDRIAFADAAFSTEETSGSATDRGLVFTLFGPPSFVQHPMVRDTQGVQAHVGDSGPMGDSLRGGAADVWAYRGDRSPSFVPVQGFDLTFEVDRAHGSWILDKVYPATMVVEKAVEHLRDTGTLH